MSYPHPVIVLIIRIGKPSDGVKHVHIGKYIIRDLIHNVIGAVKLN